MKIKKRYIAAAIPVVASIAITPYCIQAAYDFRGYEAIGGECLVIPLGIFIAFIMVRIASEWEEHIKEQHAKRLYIESFCTGKEMGCCDDRNKSKV